MINWFKYKYVSLILLACSELAAQSLQGLQENQVIKKHLIDQPFGLKSAAEETLLSLPFFEDFSIVSVFPDPSKWTDQFAFINSSFAIDPISIGVATLDAIDDKGDLYAVTNRPTSSDKLTSQNFDLSSYAFPDDTVRLSFFYQCGGKGEVPELNDSLLLEFYSPVTQEWKVNWDTTLNRTTDFQQVILVVDSVYYHSGFRFRFRNYTSMSPSDVSGGEGALSNVDCWNIDYILLNTYPVSMHRSINDIALVDPPRFLMDYYESVPWSHLNNAQSITRNNMLFVVRNLRKNNDTITFLRSYYMKNLNTGEVDGDIVIQDRLPPDGITRLSDEFNIPFTNQGNSDEGLFEVGGYLFTPPDQFKQNDTTKIILNFKDYYAYDDGTPEYGFGISGPSMAGALLACRFRVFKQDTLRALDMLFNKTRNDFTADKGFRICVWKDGKGKPGDLLYMSPEILLPVTSSTMSEFERYAINPVEDLIITDTIIYVGWKQETDDFLNIGYDVNRNNLSRTLINVSGDWFNPGGSIIPGTIMIRAVFGSKDVNTGDYELPVTSSDVVLFPNPVSETLHVESNGTLINQISIFDISGRLIIQDNGKHNTIDVSGLLPGIYQVLLITGRQQQINRKIIVGN